MGAPQPDLDGDAAAVDDAALEALLEALLEVAARKDALRKYALAVPIEQALEAAPPVEARRDEDGTLGVFRFFEIVKHDPDAMRSLTPMLAKERIEPLQSERVKIGDEVGVELPLGRLAAIALADVDAVRAGRGAGLLPVALCAQLEDEPLADAVSARLSSLRGPPPHVPLRRVVTDHGRDAVLWTSVTSAEPAELIVLVQRADEHQLIVVPAATSSAGHAALLRALAPPPADRSFWRFLEVDGPTLLHGSEGALWSDDVLGRRLSLEVKAIAISRDPSVYGVARARVRLLVWSGDRIVEEIEDLVGLPLDLPRTLGGGWPEGAALERVRLAARTFRTRLQRRLSALLEARQPRALDALGGAAVLRVLARAAADASLTALADDGAEPCPAREGPESDEELRVRFGDVVVGLSPADDSVRVRTLAGEAELFSDGALPDGDPEAWQALAHVLARALAASDADVELAFDDSDDDSLGDDSDDARVDVILSGEDDATNADGADDLGDADDATDADAHEEVGEDADADDDGAAHAMLLSDWLRQLGDSAVADARWPVRASAPEAAQIAAELVDRFVDPGPLGADEDADAANEDDERSGR